jgi:hypothetical protein
MSQLVRIEPVGDLGERFKKHQHSISNTTSIDRVLLSDVEPLLLSGFVHPGERGCHALILP